ncbi:hypothetical protein AB9K26_00590 [Psychroserpens sp. XS_ASV72]|uniref:hypothetical protein n=1 Tax=Psychroserpens sp. XS_ASV72 TaxID=3241293 RepID=UPI00351178BB
MLRPKIFIIILILPFLQSCKNEKKNDITPKINNTQFKTTISKSTFEEKLKKEPKLFLKFWSGMTENEFQKVVNILNEEKVLLGNYNNISNPIRFLVREHCYSEMYARFDNSKEPKLVSIKLYNLATFPNCLYDLYREKYGLPLLLQKTETDYEYVENNPNYAPKMSYTDENNKLVFLNDAFNDKSSFIKNNERIEKETFLPSRPTYILPENPIVINKDSLVIVIDQVKYEDKSYSYNLEQSQALRNYQSSIFNDSFNKWLDESKFIETNSKLRTVSLKSIYSINATYMSVSEYDKRKQERNDQIEDSLETEKRKKAKLLKSIESL